MNKLSSRLRLLIPISLALLSITTLFSLVLRPQAAGANPLATIFVDADATSGGNTGADWANAYTDLQTALGAAVSGDQVWVASGVYTPGSLSTDSFILTDGVAIYGGFIATETLLSERDWIANVTVLSGDIDGDDMTDSNGVVLTITHQAGTNIENIVVSDGVADTAVLDGFTITGGAGGGGGGGMLNDGGSPLVRNIVFRGNLGFGGGGMITQNGGNPTLIDVIFSNNLALIGGGLANVDSTVTLTNVLFVENYAIAHGGGIANFAGDINLDYAVMDNNIADQNGGAIFADAGIINIRFSAIENNSAYESGGGIYGDGTSVIYNVDSSTISDNTALTVRGGGLYIREGATANVVNSTISGNRAAGENGLTGDDGNGGGIYVGVSVNPSQLSLDHVTVTNNEAAGSGGGIDFNRMDFGDILTFTNSIVAGNIDTGGFPDCYDNGTSSYTLNVDANNLFGGAAGDDCVPGASDLSLTDLGLTISDVLAPLADNDGVEAGSHLSSTAVIQTHALILGGPAVDAGDSLLATDQRGVARPFGVTNDIGAYEFSIDCSAYSQLFVNHAASGADDGSSWTDAYTDLQDALLTANACSVDISEIWVASGVYTPGASMDDSFSMASGLAIYGGFAGTETLRSERDWEENVTVLSGDIDGNDTTDGHGVVVTTTNQTGVNSHNVVTSFEVDNTAVLDGFTITAGYADGCFCSNYGGGLNNENGSPVLNNLVFSGNRAGNGGGMSSYNSDYGPPDVPEGVDIAFIDPADSPTLNNVIFSGNSADFGGGMHNEMSSPTLTDVIFEDNSATVAGGGLFNSYMSGPILTGVVFAENSAEQDGGGMVNIDDSFPTLINVTFKGNSAGNDGGGVYNLGFDGPPGPPVRTSSQMMPTSPTFINVSFIGNFAGDDGGGMANITDAGCCRGPEQASAVNNGVSSPLLMNVTFSGNRALDKAGGLYNKDGSNPIIVNSIFWNNQDGTGVGTLEANLQNNLSTPLVSYSLVQGSGGSASWNGATGTDGGDNIDSDPEFVTLPDPSVAPAVVGDVQLQLTSPAIDVGNTLAYTSATTVTLDLAGSDRIFDSIIDLGPLESASYELTIDFPDAGGGMVSGLSTDCAADCAEAFSTGTVVTLTATADPGYTFTGWGTPCSGTGDCVITVTAGVTVAAGFDLDQYVLTTTIAGTGSGSISANPAGGTYAHGTVVTLTATADAGSTFDSWAGDCTGLGECVVTMDAAKSVTATFLLNPPEVMTSTIFLPIVMNNVSFTRDLIVESISISSIDIQVVVKNQGTIPILDAFWVDLYVNPSMPPTAINQAWYTQGADGGVVWGIFDMPLAAGESMTLSLSSESYDPVRSDLTKGIPVGVDVYVQVDSANLSSPNGSVVEVHEISGGEYNNISMVTTTTALLSQNAAQTSADVLARFAAMPAR